MPEKLALRQLIKEILMYVNSNEIDDELFQAIYHFVMFLNESYRRYRCYELECLGDKKWSRSDVVLTHLAMLNEYCYFDKKSLMNIFSASRVYIYGCGLIASDVIYFFKRIGVEIESIIVTDKSFEPDKLYEYEIRELNESVVQNDDVVVLAVKEKYLEEIKNSLKSKQINNYVEIIFLVM